MNQYNEKSVARGKDQGSLLQIKARKLDELLKIPCLLLNELLSKLYLLVVMLGIELFDLHVQLMQQIQ